LHADVDDLPVAVMLTIGQRGECTDCPVGRRTIVREVARYRARCHRRKTGGVHGARRSERGERLEPPGGAWAERAKVAKRNVHQVRMARDERLGVERHGERSARFVLDDDVGVRQQRVQTRGT
jgi:hypothetical protein